MGLSQLMMRAAPLLDRATRTDEESPLELIRRLATSRITTDPPKYPVLVPRSDSNLPYDDPNDSGSQPWDERLPNGRSSLELRPRIPFLPNIQNVAPDPMFPQPNPEFPNGPPALVQRNDGQDTSIPREPPRLRLVPRDSPYGSAPNISRIPDDAVESAFSRLMPRPNTPLTTTSEEPGSVLVPRPTAPLIPVKGPPGVSVTGLIYDEHGRPLKPSFIDPTSDRALKTREEYIQALEQYKPQNHNSRLKSAAITAGRGALAGLREGPGGAIGGALFGGVEGLVDPSSDEKYAKRRDIGIAEHEVARDLQTRKHLSDLADAEAERQLKNAQAIKALQGPSYKPDVMMDNENYLQSIDAVSGVAKPVTDGKGNRIKGKTNSTHEWRNDPFTGKAELWQLTPGEADKKIPGAVDAHRDLIKTDFGWVNPNTALSADATAENRNWTRAHTLQTDAERRQDRQEDLGFRRGDKDDARRQKAAALAVELEAANAESVKWTTMATSATDQKDRDYYNAQAKAEKEKAFAKAKEINEGYGDVYEAGPGDGGWPYAKPKPAPPVLQPRKPPRLKSDPLELFQQ